MPDFSIAACDSDAYSIILAGIPISRGAGLSGYDDGEFFTATQPQDSFLTFEGIDGTVTRDATNTHLIQMSIKLLQVSPTNDILSRLLIADTNVTTNGAGVGSFKLQDQAGTTQIICPRCWIRKPADITLDRGAKGREWILDGIATVYMVGSN
jgi:hypothetical protein